MSRLSSRRRNLAVMIMAILSGSAVAIAIVANQPEPSELAQKLPQQPSLLRPAADPPTNSLALPLTKISVEAAPPTIIVRNVKIAKGDTLMSVMIQNGSDRPTAHAAITALSKSYDPRRVRPGQALTLLFDPKKPKIEGRLALIQLAFAPSVEQVILVSLNNKGGFESETFD